MFIRSTQFTDNIVQNISYNVIVHVHIVLSYPLVNMSL